MNVTIVEDPIRALEMIRIHRPELILMNVSMPLLSGLELTRIIRQVESFAGVAIIYISADVNFKNHLAAMTSGGDAIIDVPVAPEYLVATINARVSRARTLTSINHDLYTTVRELENQQFALNQHAIVSITNINGMIIYVNKKFCDISGYTKAELIGRDHHLLDSGHHDQNFFKELWTTIEAGRVWQGEVCNRNKAGGLYWVNMTIVPFIDEQGRPYQYVAINTDITPRKNVERDLLVARDQAINASQAKSEFLSRMSHELRTPLNAVLGFSQLLESSRDGPLSEAQSQYLSEIHNAGDHLLHLINDVLDLSRIESNQLLIESINIPMAPFLDECAALILPFARQKKIEILAPYNRRDEIAVFADPLRLKQVVVNLLSNAVKYNQASGTIVIDAMPKESGAVLIEVTDSGPGISRMQLEEIFQPFARLPQHRNEEGAGIGLALSKRLTELMGGRIGAISTIGSGTTVWIEIPGGERITDDAALPSLDNIRPAPAVAAPHRPVSLLYIEDNDANLLLVREILRDRPDVLLLHSYTVKSGFETALAHHPGLILMDLDLPDMSGLEGISLLRNHPDLADIPVIAVSAYSDRENMQRAMQLGFTGYISKPVDVNGLVAQIDKYCR
jgi:PAS domain S-box-containing protein